ncbi:hypothetical protein Tco_1539289 [Tanacetum coccineum]
MAASTIFVLAEENLGDPIDIQVDIIHPEPVAAVELKSLCSRMKLVAYTDSDYAGASLDRKFTTGGCQFLGCRLISWQCMKQIVVANSTTEAEYVDASGCYGQVALDS